jgi:ABC-type sugar transport system substrate-binding protein
LVRGFAAALAVVCAVLAVPPAAAAAEEDEVAGIIVVGVPGLAWTDIDEDGGFGCVGVDERAHDRVVDMS